MAASTTTQLVEFIDFGCGAGKSLAYMRKLTDGYGFGLDISEAAISECRSAGLPAEVGDLLSYTGKNTTAAAVAINLLPEIGSRPDFEQAVSRMILAARNYVMIQHDYFDADGELALAGLYDPDHFSKKLRFKPSVADYLVLVARFATTHAISGVAIFGLAEAQLKPLLPAGSISPPDAAVESPAGIAAYRTLRVVIGRKEVSRFRAALRKTRSGQELFLWERPDPSAE